MTIDKFDHDWMERGTNMSTKMAGSANYHASYSFLEPEILIPEMTFLAENPEAFGLVPDACPLSTKHLLIAANGHSAEGGSISPMIDTEEKGIDGLFSIYGDLFPRTEEVADALQAAFGANKSGQEYPVSRYCAALTEVTALQILRNAAFEASFEQTRVMLADGLLRNMRAFRKSFRNEEGKLQWADDFFSVSLGVCRVREAGGGDYIADVFSAGDFSLYLLDAKGMAPLWCTPTPTFSCMETDGEWLIGKTVRFHHPEPFALLLISESVCGLNASELRNLRSNPGLIWRYRMRLEDYFLRLITDCVREYEFGNRAVHFFMGRSHGHDSASGAMTILRDGVSYEVFRLHCQNRLSVLSELTELLPDGYDPRNVPQPGTRAATEMTYLRQLLERDSDLSDRLVDALRACAVQKLRKGPSAEPLPLPENVPDYSRLEWADVHRAYRVYDCENDEDRSRIENNARVMREGLSEHWVTLRPLLTEPRHNLPQDIQNYRRISDQIYDVCRDMNSRLSELLEQRRKTIAEIGRLMSDGLDMLDAEGNDWVCGRAGADSVLAWAEPLTTRLPMQLQELQRNWSQQTEHYRTMLTAYTAERDKLFLRDICEERGSFFGDWCAMRDGCLPEGRWELFRDRLVNTPETVEFLNLFDSLYRISHGTGALLHRIRTRAAENRMARDLSGRQDLQVLALRGAAYEDPDWGDAVIRVMDMATRNGFRATVRKWQRTCELIEKREKAYREFSAMYEAYMDL